MIEITAPRNINGETLSEEISAAGFSDIDLVLVDKVLVVHGVDESRRAALEDVVKSHIPPTPAVEVPPLTNKEIVALRALIS
jgi:hypothetical protein